MKRKVAVFANGWSNEYLRLVLEGIRERAREENVDLFVFVNYSSGNSEDPSNIGEKGLFLIPDLREFAGVILLANTINISVEREYLSKEIQRNGIPAIALEYEMEGIPYLGTDTYHGVYDLVNHVITEHDAKKLLFISGPKDNEESNLRLKATREAMEKHGLTLTDEQVFEAGWSYHLAYDKISAWVKQVDGLPDAVICANDEMAVGVCSGLEKEGIKVPKQIIVTGCDCITEGQGFYPILSTVARGWDKLGYSGMDLLLKQLTGQQIPLKTVFHASLVLGESCGCEVDEERKQQRLFSILNENRRKRGGNRNEWHFRYVDEMLAKITNAQDLKLNMSRYLEYDHHFVGDDFSLCLIDDFFKDDESKVVKVGVYTKNMEACVNLRNGKIVDSTTFPTKQLLPDYIEDSEKSHVYIFAPLHIEDSCIGYIMQKDNPERVYDGTLYIWLRHISQDLERVRQNIQVEELNKKLRDVSITDALTGLRNRVGFDVLALPYLQKCQSEGRNSAIVFADVNRMKMINDKYGHLQGDTALCTVAEAIKKTLPMDWIAVRYGGDEFIMVGACEDMAEAEEIKERLAANLEEVKEKRKLSFPLTSSLGAVIMHPGENYSLEEYLRKADQAMYVAKQKYHETEEK